MEEDKENYDLLELFLWKKMFIDGDSNLFNEYLEEKDKKDFNTTDFFIKKKMFTENDLFLEFLKRNKKGKNVMETIPITHTELIKKIDNYSEENFEQLFKDILNNFAENGKHEDINDLSNLVLLDAETNRSYKNAVFPVKRKIIIAREKEGTFVPICTRNVFMKYYSPQIEQMTIEMSI